MHTDSILLAGNLVLAVAAIWCAVDVHRYARRSEASARRAQAASRRAWGVIAEMQRRNLRTTVDHLKEQ